MEPNKVIRKARGASGLLQKELADRVGCSQQTVVDIESGRIKRSKYLADICAELGLDYKRLIQGGKASDAELVAFDFGTPVPVVPLDKVGDWLNDPASVDLEGAPRHPCPVEHSRLAFAVRTSGDSMEPDIRHGDLVHVDPSQSWSSGDIVCLFIGSSSAPMFRRVFVEGADVYAVASRDDTRRPLHLVDRLSEVESSALTLLNTGPVAFIAGRAIFASRSYV